MRNITIRLTSNGTSRPIELGFTGENEVTQITFDCTDWLQEFGDGGLTVSAQRDGDAHPYTVILTKVDDTHYVWVLNREVDLAKAGLGIFEAEYIVDEVIKKSATYRYNVIKSMGEDTEQPEPYVAWIADAQEISAEVAQNAYNAAQSALQAQEALEEFTSITVSVNTLPAGSQATASYLDGHLTLGIPQGEKGDKGDKGDTGETGNGIASVVLNSDYTLTINFTNGDSTTTTSIRGERGERGIQGETGETGNGIQSAVLNADYTLTLTFTNGDTYTTPSIRGEKGDAGVVQDVTVNGQSVLSGNVANITIPQITKTVTGNPIVVDDADGAVQALDVSLLPVQEGSGTPSPQNIRPITGRTQTEITDRGKNLLPTKAYTNVPYNPTAGTAVAPTEKPKQWTDNNDGTFTMTLSSWEQASFIMPPLTAGKSTIRLTTVTAGMRIGVYVVDADNTVNRISTIKNGSSANELFQVTTTLTEGQYFAVYVAGGSGSCTIKEPQCEYGETATSYAPYKSTTKTVTLPHTVYGADVDVTGGASEATVRYLTIDGNTNIGKESTGWAQKEVFYIEIGTGTNKGKQTSYAEVCNIISNQCVATSYNGLKATTQSGEIAFTEYGRWIEWTSDSTSVAEEKARLGASPLQIAYELATPTPLTTDPTPLTLYKGDNVVSSDGDMEMTYVRNLQAVIDKLENA